MISVARGSKKRKSRKPNHDLPEGGYNAWPHVCSEHWCFKRLNPLAKALLFELLGQYRGNNNGDLTCSHSILKDRGGKSRTTVEKYREELERSGWIVRTRQGGRNQPNLYALTFRKVDECKGKLDGHIKIEHRYDYWKTGDNPMYMPTETASKRAA